MTRRRFPRRPITCNSAPLPFLSRLREAQPQVEIVGYGACAFHHWANLAGSIVDRPTEYGVMRCIVQQVVTGEGADSPVTVRLLPTGAPVAVHWQKPR